MGGLFVYANPPVIRWGAGSIGHLADESARLGCTRVAFVTTRSLAAGGPVLRRVHSALGGTSGAPTVTVGQHAPLDQVERAARELEAAPPDLIVSVGGGSPIDAAKVIARRLSERRPDGSAAEGGSRVAHVAVPTTLSVAELASGAGVTDDAGNKVGLRDPRMLPDVVIYDGELALHTPLELWLSTGIRALDHAVEGYLSAGEHPLSDVLALEAVRRVFRTLPLARERPGDASVRTENQLAAWFAYTLPGPTAAGLSHTMGKQIGARHGIPHGVTSCLLLPHVMRYLASRQPDRLAALSQATGTGGGPASAADDVARLIVELGLPRNVAAYGLQDRDLVTAAETMAGEHSAADLLEIYRAAM